MSTAGLVGKRRNLGEGGSIDDDDERKTPRVGEGANFLRSEAEWPVVPPERKKWESVRIKPKATEHWINDDLAAGPQCHPAFADSPLAGFHFRLTFAE